MSSSTAVLGLPSRCGGLKENYQKTVFGDRLGNILQGSRILRAMFTVKDGNLLYRNMGF